MFTNNPQLTEAVFYVCTASIVGSMLRIVTAIWWFPTPLFKSIDRTVVCWVYMPTSRVTLWGSGASVFAFALPGTS